MPSRGKDERHEGGHSRSPAEVDGSRKRARARLESPGTPPDREPLAGDTSTARSQEKRRSREGSTRESVVRVQMAFEQIDSSSRRKSSTAEATGSSSRTGAASRSRSRRREGAPVADAAPSSENASEAKAEHRRRRHRRGSNDDAERERSRDRTRRRFREEPPEEDAPKLKLSASMQALLEGGGDTVPPPPPPEPPKMQLSATMMALLAAPQSSGSCFEFEVIFDRSRGERLGIDVDPVDGEGTLVINRLNEGVVTTWNASNPGKEVLVGDQLLEVNGIRGDSMLLVEQCKQMRELRVTIKRARDEALKLASVASMGEVHPPAPKMFLPPPSEDWASRPVDTASGLMRLAEFKTGVSPHPVVSGGVQQRTPRALVSGGQKPAQISACVQFKLGRCYWGANCKRPHEAPSTLPRFTYQNHLMEQAQKAEREGKKGFTQ